MNKNMPDKNNLIESIVAASGGKINRNNLNAAASGDISGILGALSEEDGKKLMAALSDKQKAQQLLNSDAARALISALMGGGKG